jgi:hypothetical protein
MLVLEGVPHVDVVVVGAAQQDPAADGQPAGGEAAVG